MPFLSAGAEYSVGSSVSYASDDANIMPDATRAFAAPKAPLKPWNRPRRTSAAPSETRPPPPPPFVRALLLIQREPVVCQLGIQFLERDSRLDCDVQVGH